MLLVLIVDKRIILNLSCNIENQKIRKLLIRMGLIKQLLRILFDPRHDWPSNGASLSLLQYSHLSPSDADLYYSLKNEGVSEAISDFLDICESADIKKNLY